MKLKKNSSIHANSLHAKLPRYWPQYNHLTLHVWLLLCVKHISEYCKTQETPSGSLKDELPHPIISYRRWKIQNEKHVSHLL